jgi:ABC-type multidrug transport system fused ATPase/permease subunit
MSRRDTDTRRGLRLLRPYIREQRRPFVLAILLLAFEAGTAVLAAAPIAYLIDFLTQQQPSLTARFGLPVVVSPYIDTIAVLTLGILVLAIVNSTGDSLAEIALAKGGRRLGYQLRVGLYGHLQRLSLAYHDQRRTGDVVTRLTGDITVVEEFVTRSASDLIGSVFVLVGSLTFLLTKSWHVALLAAVMVPLISGVSNFFSTRIKMVAKRLRAREGDVASAAQEMLTSIRVIQTYGRGGYEERRFAEQSSAALDVALQAARLEAWFSGVVKVLEAATTVAVVWVGVWLIGRTRLSIGTLVLCILLIDNMFKPTKRIVKEWARIGKLIASLERIGDVSDRQPTVFDAQDAVEAPPFQAAIEFCNVSFAYRADPVDGSPEQPDTREALRDVSFRVAPGEVVALVGRSGAGKTTVAQLLPRLYDPDAGQVLIDGFDVRQFTLASLRSQISMVLQDTVLFTGTVADNIAYGRTDAAREEIIAAAKQANAHEFIITLEDGYDTMLGERAATLSGGQRQRIAIARALIRGAPILILDEPTTGLDAKSTDLVLEALRTLMVGKTTLIISHDLNLVRHADVILVLEAGRIVQVGTHDDLIRQQDGIYGEFYVRQFGVLNGSSAPALVPDRRKPVTAMRAGVPMDSLTRADESVDGLAALDTQELPVPVRAHELEIVPRADARRTQDQWRSADFAASTSGSRGTRVGHGLEPLARLPGWLEDAADAERVRGVLARTVTEFASGAMVLESCVPDRLRLKGERWTVSYDARVREHVGTPPRMPVEHAASKGILVNDERVVGLAGILDPPQTAGGVTEVRGSFGSSEWRCRLPELNLSLWTRPADGALSALRLLADPETCRVLLEDTVGLRIAACRPRVLRYKYGSRCTVLVELDYPAGVVGPDLVVAKIYRGTEGGNAYRGMRALWNSPLASGDVVTIAEPLAYLPYLRLLVQGPIPQQQTLEDLLRSAIGTDDPIVDENLRRYMHQTAFGLAALHTCGVEYGADVTFDDEVAQVRKRCAWLAGPAPGIVEAVEPVLSQIQARAAACSPDPFAPAHRNFLPTHVLLSQGQVGFTDFGGICRAEPALDLARFCSGVKTVELDKLHGGSDPLARRARFRELEEFCEAFVSSYSALVPVNRERVMLWEALDLLTAVLNCWTKVQPHRLDAALFTLTQHLRVLGVHGYDR